MTAVNATSGNTTRAMPKRASARFSPPGLRAYAGASRITVELRATPVHLRIAVRDDGTGIAPDEKRQGAGIGNMRTRARLISARFEVMRNRDADGTPGGTSVEVSLPLSQTASFSGSHPG